MPHTYAESQEARVSPVPVDAETAWCFWPGPEGGLISLELLHAEGISGRMTDRQMADRARDHTYN